MTKQLKTVPGGLLIAFDGLDGSGETTQLNLTRQALEADGWLVETTRNLGGTPIGEELRTVMFSLVKRPSTVDLYLSVAIQEALAEKINEDRAKGAIILLDRSPLSLVAYHSYGGDGEKTLGWHYADQGMAKFKPELVIVYTCDIDTAIARQSKAKVDYYGSQPKAFFERVRKGYQVAIERYKAEFIDANQSIETVQSKTMKLVNKALTKA